MENKMQCPRCERRVFDVSRIPQKDLYISLKCPHCKKIVTIKCDKTAVLKCTK